jgi:hypothetical protein
MLVSSRSIRLDRGDIDKKARKIVLGAYSEGCRIRSASPFDVALNSYRNEYPHVARELAGHAVAHILSTAKI